MTKGEVAHPSCPADGGSDRGSDGGDGQEDGEVEHSWLADGDRHEQDVADRRERAPEHHKEGSVAVSVDKESGRDGSDEGEDLEQRKEASSQSASEARRAQRGGQGLT
jgi:hypothetical protein